VENLRAAGLVGEIHHVRDGQEALDYFVGALGEAGPPAGCVVLLDIRMPKLGGIELLRRLRHDHGFRSPIIMLTTSDDPREIETCYEFGCSAYIQKPVDYDAFTETVRRLGDFIACCPRLASRIERAPRPPAAARFVGRSRTGLIGGSLAVRITACGAANRQSAPGAAEAPTPREAKSLSRMLSEGAPWPQ
jgi:CheY-like chemotaxis protein